MTVPFQTPSSSIDPSDHPLRSLIHPSTLTVDAVVHFLIRVDRLAGIPWTAIVGKETENIVGLFVSLIFLLFVFAWSI